MALTSRGSRRGAEEHTGDDRADTISARSVESEDMRPQVAICYVVLSCTSSLAPVSVTKRGALDEVGEAVVEVRMELDDVAVAGQHHSFR